MSESTPCNYCSLRSIRANANEHELRVTLLPSGFRESGVSTEGTDIYAHPKDVTISLLATKKREQYFSAWMWTIPDKCCC